MDKPFWRRLFLLPDTEAADDEWRKAVERSEATLTKLEESTTRLCEALDKTELHVRPPQ